MSTITAYCYVNPIEPQSLSLRVPSGIETTLDLTFFDQLDAPITTDLLAQLELISRTGGAPIWCAVPSTDMVNGKARASLPVSAMTDPNGYRLRLYGTVGGESILLAIGVIDITATTDRTGGVPGTALPFDVIDTIDMTLERGKAALLNVAVWSDSNGTIPLDLSTAVVSAMIYANKGGVAIMPFTAVVKDVNIVELSLTADQVDALPESCWWALMASGASGLSTLAEGSVTITGTIQQPLPTTTDSWDYTIPMDVTEPLVGQIAHCGVAQNILRIHTISQPGTDQSALLAMLAAGDRITIGATTWTVQLTFFNTTGWYDIMITPIMQGAAPGVVSVLFEAAPT